MNKPKMILFDYGQTLFDEKEFNTLRGNQEVLDKCIKDKKNICAKDIQDLAMKLSADIRKLDSSYQLEIHGYQFNRYLYEYFNLEFNKPIEDVETIFFDATSSPFHITNHIYDLLDFLKKENSRIGIISNLSFSSKTLTKRVNQFFPNYNFEFIITSSEYIFRKPHPRIFEIALKKASLNPEDVWYCGDNQICDINGASNMGIFPIWYCGASKNITKIPDVNHLKINDWNDLINILKNIQ